MNESTSISTQFEVDESTQNEEENLGENIEKKFSEPYPYEAVETSCQVQNK